MLFRIENPDSRLEMFLNKFEPLGTPGVFHGVFQTHDGKIIKMVGLFDNQIDARAFALTSPVYLYRKVHHVG